MFTGIIEYSGVVRSVRFGSAGGVVSVDIGPLAEGTKLGDSIAVNGVCLTVTKLTGSVADFDVSGETVSKSSIGKLTGGAKVNLERAMLASGRFGGHIVQGHVDGLAKITAVEKKGDFVEIRFDTPGELLSEIVAKGSVAIDGISLTVAKLDAKGFSVAVIPVTLQETTLNASKIGDIVNIETDIICKTIKRQLEQIAGKGKGLTLDKLRDMGF
ncbi:MAG: riboflavin synthase [Phycisphaerae bacterium]|nr:riboflavin synthase [Phycisphaerae bacterium]